MTEVFRIVLAASLSAGIAALMVICARLIIGRRPTPLLRVFYILLIIRLAVPVSVQSPLSVMNFFSAPVYKTVQVLETPVYTPIKTNDAVIKPLNAKETQIIGSGNESVYKADNVSDTSAIHSAPTMSLLDICVIIWLCGMTVFSVMMVFGNARFIKYLSKNRSYNAIGFDELLTDCKNELGLRKRVETVQASAIDTAAVYGALRPKLIISPKFESLSYNEKRHVLLHELSHIKRRDNLLCLVASVLSIVYWFNPLIWVAFMLMRKDIEVMCDTQALKRIDDRRDYAMTLLNLASTSQKVKPSFVSALFVSTDAIKRRINMIVKNRKNSVLITIVGMILVIAIAICGCTGAVTPTKAQTSTAPPGASQETPKPSASESNVDVVSDGTYTVTYTDESNGSNSTTITKVSVFTIDNGGISITVPEGWVAKNVNSDGLTLGMIANTDSGESINIESSLVSDGKNKITAQTPDSIMSSMGFYISEDVEGKVQSGELCLKSLASEPLTVDGVDGELFEITGTVTFSKAEKHGYCAIFVDNGKSYTMYYLTDSDKFEKNKDIVKSIISSAEFN